MRSECARRFAAVYFALFFCAVAVAPHTHLNGLEDLLFDQPSDSGIIPQPAARAPQQGPAVAPLRYIRDVPCLACFTRDFVASPAATFAFVAVLTPLAVRPAPPPLARPDLVPAETASRAPPAA